MFCDVAQGKTEAVKKCLEEYPEYIKVYSDDYKRPYHEKNLLRCACGADSNKKNRELIQFLISKGLQAGNKSLYDALKRDFDLSIIELLLTSPKINLKEKCDVLHGTGWSTWTTQPLGYALLNKRYDVVPVFLKKDATLKDATACSFKGKDVTPLHYFIFFEKQVDDGMVYAIKSLLDGGVEPLLQMDAESGNTIFHFVAQASPSEKITEYCETLLSPNAEEKKIMKIMLWCRKNKKCILSVVPCRLMIHMLNFLPKARLCSVLQCSNVDKKTAQAICLDRARQSDNTEEKKQFLLASEILSIN